jgi:hypothetical protein
LIIARAIATRCCWPPESSVGLALEVALQAQRVDGLLDARAISLFGTFALEPVGDVVAHAHVRVERVVLEHHRDAALLRRSGR